MEHNSDTQPPDIALSDTTATTTANTTATPRVPNSTTPIQTRQTRTRARNLDESTPDAAHSSTAAASASFPQPGPAFPVPITTPRPRRSARISISGHAQEAESATPDIPKKR